MLQHQQMIQYFLVIMQWLTVFLKHGYKRTTVLNIQYLLISLMAIECKTIIVPFFPLYKHKDMFFTADRLGYKCEIKPVPQGLEKWQIALIVIASLLTILGVLIIIIVSAVRVLNKRKKQKEPKINYNKI